MVATLISVWSGVGGVFGIWGVLCMCVRSTNSVVRCSVGRCPYGGLQAPSRGGYRFQRVTRKV